MTASNLTMLCVVSVILLFLLPRSHAEKCLASDGTENQLWPLNKCCKRNLSTVGSNGTGESDFIVTYGKEGTINVTFPLDANKERIIVNLYVHESYNYCNDSTIFQESSVERHSRADYKIYGEGDSKCSHTCTKTGTIIFPRIYTGCYLIYISKSQLRLIEVKTDYKKSPIWESLPFILSNITPSTNKTYNVEVNISCFDMFFTEKLQVNVYLNKQNVCGGAEILNHISMDLLNQGSFTCHQKGDISSSCEVEGGATVKCLYENVPSGNYYVLVEPFHPYICDYISAWAPGSESNDCCFSHHLDTNVTNSLSSLGSPIETENEVNHLIVIGAVIGCILIVLISYIILRIYTRKRQYTYQRAISTQNVLLQCVKNDDLPQPKVLLLYAQDSKPFMKMMETFRKLLSKSGNCEVLDCFDPDLEEDVSASPNEWMCYWASNSNVKIVVVASDCAVEHQKALSTNCALQYLEPIPFNQLFLCGLKEVTYNQKKDYLNTFVVRFDDKDLNYLTPYTRFMLPQHLEDLIRYLNPQIDFKNLKDSKEFQILYEDHTDLINFKQQNPQFILQLLTRTE